MVIVKIRVKTRQASKLTPLWWLLILQALIHQRAAFCQQRLKSSNNNHPLKNNKANDEYRSGLLVEKWTVEIPDGQSAADKLANEHDCTNLGLVRGFSNVYLFEKKAKYDASDESHMHRTKRQFSLIKDQLESHPAVTWVDPQKPQMRFKRDLLNLRALLRSQTKVLRSRLDAFNADDRDNRRIQKTLLSLPLLSGQRFAGGPRLSSTGRLLASIQPALPPLQMQPPLSQQQQQQKQQQQDSQQLQAQQQQLHSKNGGGKLVAHSSPAAFKESAERGAYATLAQSEELKKFNDELWSHQWYLQDKTNAAQMQGDVELNVEDVWKMGLTGAGVVVTILDDGLEWNHTDIYPNYDPRASFDMNNNRSDPFPRYDSLDTNNHGTRCAGEVAMVANNRKCGVGVAPRARIGGIKCLDGEVVDSIESMSLLHNIDYIDIYSGSWGPSDNGQVVEGPKRLAAQALERGVRFGRRGKGALYVWANGNGGALGDNCNCDGYVNSIYTISIGGVTQQGQIPFYGERCSSTMAVTSSSGAYTDRKIVTTDLHNKCTIDYTGTSAAAPLAAGVFALVLEANTNLTWRDAQHLVAWTSNPVPVRDNAGWHRNAAGLLFNSRFGFGLLDARQLVSEALRWQQVPRKSVCAVASASPLPTLLGSRTAARIVFASDGCQREIDTATKITSLPSSPSSSSSSSSPSSSLSSGKQKQPPAPVIFLEHVQVVVDIEYTSRGALDIFIVSPSGTVSTLLTRRPLDTSRKGFDRWPLMSVHFWGESAIGQWTLIVRDKDSANNRGLLRNATLVLHGTTTRPAHMTSERDYSADVRMLIDPTSEFNDDDIYDQKSFQNELSLAAGDSYEPTLINSIIAAEHQQSALLS